MDQVKAPGQTKAVEAVDLHVRRVRDGTVNGSINSKRFYTDKII